MANAIWLIKENRISMSSKNTTKRSSAKNAKRNYVAIYYKSNGKYVGPWGGAAIPRKEFESLRNEGVLTRLSNYVLRSPLQYRYQTAA
jgi:hypothetical protein